MCAIPYYRGRARDRSERDPLVGPFFLCIAIAGNYYEYDAIAPIADFLRTQRGFTQSQIGMLNTVFSLPNIGLALVGGLLIGSPRAGRRWRWGCFCVLRVSVHTRPIPLRLGRERSTITDGRRPCGWARPSPGSVWRRHALLLTFGTLLLSLTFLLLGGPPPSSHPKHAHLCLNWRAAICGMLLVVGYAIL